MVPWIVYKAFPNTVRGVRAVARWTGVLAALERRRSNRLALWFRSLFSMHNIDDLIALDVAWWTIDALSLVDRFLDQRPDARVFEFGSGASTVFLARRAASVHTVEHHEAWSRHVESLVAEFPNVHTMLHPPAEVACESAYGSGRRGYKGADFEDYVKAIDEVDGAFDLIVIDGRCRERCLEHARSRLTPGGMILFDNSGRSRYRDAIESSGLHAHETSGLTIAVPFREHTTLLFEDPKERDALLAAAS